MNLDQALGTNVSRKSIIEEEKRREVVRKRSTNGRKVRAKPLLSSECYGSQ